MQQVFARIRELSQNDHDPNEIEDYIYLYKGGNDGRNNNRIPRSSRDYRRREIWMRIRASLRNNMLRLYTDLTAPNNLCYELPVHMHGYHVLVRKGELMDEYVNPDHAIDDIFMQTQPSMRMFTLVTYYRMFTFAVEGPEKMVRWISRFGYRFCCNPQSEQLCFSYYLPPGEAPNLPRNVSDTPPSWAETSPSSTPSDIDSNFSSSFYPSTIHTSDDNSTTSDTTTSVNTIQGNQTFFGTIRSFFRNAFSRVMRNFLRNRNRRRRHQFRRELIELEERNRAQRQLRLQQEMLPMIMTQLNVRAFLSTITIAPHCHCESSCQLLWSPRLQSQTQQLRRVRSWTPARMSFSATFEPRSRSANANYRISVRNWLTDYLTSILLPCCSCLFCYQFCRVLFGF